MGKRWIDTDEAASILGVSKALIRKWIFNKTVPFVKFGRAVRFDYDVILEVGRTGV